MSTETALMHASYLPWDTPRSDKKRFGTLVVLALLVFFFTVIWIELAPPMIKPTPIGNMLPERVATWVLPDIEEEFIFEEIPIDEPTIETRKIEPVATKALSEPEATPKPKTQREIIAEQRVREHTQVLDDSLSSLDDFMPIAPTQLRQSAQNANQPRHTSKRLEARQQQVSGGISSAPISATGGVDASNKELAQTSTRQAQSNITQAQAPRVATSTTQTATGSRSQTDIRRVFDRYSGRFNSAYQRALRDNPALQGEIIVALTITANGNVTDATIHGSTLNDSALENRILLIVRAMDFGAANVSTWSGHYPLNFFPY